MGKSEVNAVTAIQLHRRSMSTSIRGALLTVAIVGLGCRPQRTQVPPLCTFDTLSEAEQTSKTLSPVTWLSLTAPGLDRERMVREGGLRSACGQQHERLSERTDFNCPVVDFTAERVPGDTVEPTDLVLSQVGDGKVLLWAATDELTNGEAEGPAALALWTDDGLEVHGVGLLRGYRTGARLRLHHIGPTPVVLLEGDRCDPSGRCTSIGQVVPFQGKLLREYPVWESDRGCIGRAQFELRKTDEQPLEDGWVRRFSLIRALELTETGVMITDLISMADFDAGQPDAPPRPFRKITAKRPLELVDDRFQFTDEDLWERALRDFGSAEVHTTDG